MTTAQLTKAPAKAGVAEIVFGHGMSRRGPLLFGSTIIFDAPFKSFTLFQLQGGEQFLAFDAPAGIGRTPRSFFGGTDEQPFLVELDRGHARTFVDHGEAAFYDGLKPQRIKELERTYGADGTTRQGDIWPYRLPLSWDEVVQDHLRARGNGFITHRGRSSVLGTRHTIDGIVARHGVHLARLDESVGAGRLMTGTLTAPDHEPRQLDEPHVAYRTPGIVPTQHFGQGLRGD